jgi:hypothetical protein
MKVKITSVANPIWADAEQTLIDCQITVSQFGSEVLPFTAMQNDIAEHGRVLFAELVDGKHGPIANYIPPSNDVLADKVRMQRNQLLAETDWTQAGDVPQTTKDAWAAYRQALRDIPQQAGFPVNVTFPTKP